MRILSGNSEYLDIHSHHPFNEPGLVRIFNQFINENKVISESLLLSVGLHPWHINEYQKIEDLEKELLNACLKENVVLIGETGLDKYREKDLGYQIEIFKKHIRISENLRKPLIIHCVRAFDELHKIRKDENPKQHWIIHGFDSSPEMAASLVNQGLFLSVGERLLKKAIKSKLVLSCIPLSNLFIESDDGNSSIPFLYEQVASIYLIDVKELKEYIIGNFNRIFHD